MPCEAAHILCCLGLSGRLLKADRKPFHGIWNDRERTIFAMTDKGHGIDSLTWQG